MKRSEGKQTGKQKIEESEDKTMKKVWTSKKTEEKDEKTEKIEEKRVKEEQIRRIPEKRRGKATKNGRKRRKT